MDSGSDYPAQVQRPSHDTGSDVAVAASAGTVLKGRRVGVSCFTVSMASLTGLEKLGPKRQGDAYMEFLCEY